MRIPVFRVRGIAGVVVATIAPYLVACHGVQNAPAADPGLATEPRWPPERRVLDRRPTYPPRRRRGRSASRAGLCSENCYAVLRQRSVGRPRCRRTRRCRFPGLQETGGSGTFFYAVAALDLVGGYVGSHGVLLGDRIAPQTTELRADGVVVVSYADHAPGESLSTPPSVAKSIWLKLDPTTRQFGEVVQGFEGEADPAAMTLDMKTWTWIRALYNDGREIVPRQTGAFTLTFQAGGVFAATTDCNRINGPYTVNGRDLAFGKIAATRMFCEGAQETAFTELLEKTSRYFFTGQGQLVLELELDSGSVIFR